MTDPREKERQRLIEQYRLRRHPEGGWYRRAVESQQSQHTLKGSRPTYTSIIYLLGGSEKSRPHRVFHDEIWHFLGGSNLILSEYSQNCGYCELQLGTDVSSELVHVVSGGAWQAARSVGSWSLAGCTVVPGFDFADFEIAVGPFLEELLSVAPRMAQFVR